MAIMQLSIKNISRGRGSSAVASAAYIARTKLLDERRHRSFDYTARGGLVHSELLLPGNVPTAANEWARDRQKLWNTAERAEARPNARVAREFVVALPHELPEQTRLALARGFAQTLADRYGVAADLAVHTAPTGGDRRNHHAHVLTTTRVVEADGLGRKDELTFSETKRRQHGLHGSAEEFRRLRSDWAERVNEQLREAGLKVSIDARSYWERGIPQVAQPTFGPRRIALERAGVTDPVAKLREEHAARNQLMRELAAAAAANRQPGASATQQLPALEVKPRDAGADHSDGAAKAVSVDATLSLEERLRRAAERWLAYREELSAGKHATPREAMSQDHDHGADFER